MMMKAKLSFVSLVIVIVLAGMVGTSAQARNSQGGSKTYAQQATQAPTAAASDNPYLDSLLKRQKETYDTSKFKKKPPFKLALASQGATNSWAALFDAHVRWEVSKLGKDVVSELLYADANGSADKQVPQMEDLLSQNPD